MNTIFDILIVLATLSSIGTVRYVFVLSKYNEEDSPKRKKPSRLVGHSWIIVGTAVVLWLVIGIFRTFDLAVSHITPSSIKSPGWIFFVIALILLFVAHSNIQRFKQQ